MIRSGKCPGCGSVPSSIMLETTEGRVGLGGTAYKLVSYLCAGCRTILGVEMDPIALKSDIINGVKKSLGR